VEELFQALSELTSVRRTAGWRNSFGTAFPRTDESSMQLAEELMDWCLTARQQRKGQFLPTWTIYREH